ncbi:hypothetical protein BT96DRAFT_639160 [Gymnopus androsaceus JB14]|uniref:Actin-like ATPase domain-containing protein n=1 Tax=Gymnopus androsaceus JB14 TaxID=1447944 RepID=A0A6A4HRD6_9AGAR|nr:hypothetical protein BT96DRAFT_639160 [Gymnopus androsaceus JB14]
MRHSDYGVYNRLWPLISVFSLFRHYSPQRTMVYDTGLGISFSSLEKDSTVFCTVIAANPESRLGIREAITTDVKSVVRRIYSIAQIPLDAYVYAVASIPIYFSLEEETIVREAFDALPVHFMVAFEKRTHLESIHFVLGKSLARKLPEVVPEYNTCNELVLDIGDKRTGYEVNIAGTREGYFTLEKNVLKGVCESTVNDIHHCVKEVTDSLQMAPSQIGNELGRILVVYHGGSSLARDIALKLTTGHLSDLIASSVSFITCDEPDTYAGEEAYGEGLWYSWWPYMGGPFCRTMLRVGINLSCSNQVFTIFPKCYGIPQSRSAILEIPSENAVTLNIIAGGPEYRVHLAEIKLDLQSFAPAMEKRVRFLIKVDDVAHAHVIVSQILDSGEQGEVLGNRGIRCLWGDLENESIEEAMAADRDDNLDPMIKWTRED